MRNKKSVEAKYDQEKDQGKVKKREREGEGDARMRGKENDLRRSRQNTIT